MLFRSAVDALKFPVTVARTLGREVGPLLVFGGKKLVGAFAGTWRRIPGAAGEAMQGFVPRTRFNGQVTPQRVTEGVRFDLGTAEKMRAKIPGGTVNDVAIATIAGAMRRYMEARLDAPAHNLVAEAPIASRSATRIDRKSTRLNSSHRT